MTEMEQQYLMEIKTIWTSINRVNSNRPITIEYDDKIQYNLPIPDHKTLNDIEENLRVKEYALRFIEVCRTFRPTTVARLKKSFCISQLLSEELIFDFNWGGTKGKKSFKKYTKLNYCLLGE